MRTEIVRRQADDLDFALLEIGGTARHFRKLGGAYRSEVIGVREQDGLASTLVSINQRNIRYPSYPRVTDPLMEIDGPFGGYGIKVRRSASQAKSRHYFQG